MASPVACVGVADAAGAPPQAAPSNLPGLQLLLRILPFRSSKHQQRPIKVRVRGSCCKAAMLLQHSWCVARACMHTHFLSCVAQLLVNTAGLLAVSCLLRPHKFVSSRQGLTPVLCCCAASACVPPMQLPHASTSLEELHRHPLWRYGSTAAQWPEPRSTSSHHSSRPLAPAEAESALLAYVRMAAEAEQQAGSSPRQQARRLAQLSPTDIAAELHALYTLAAIHVAHQQESPEQQQGVGSRHKQQHGSKPPLTEGDVMQLLKAYSALEDRGHQQQQQQQQPGSGDGSSGPEWDSQAQAAAAAMGALYAFARLADQQQEQSQGQQEHDVGQQDGQPGQQAQRAQQPTTAAPGQLQASSGSDSNTVQQAFKSLAASSSMDGMRGSNSSNSSSAASGDLQVLLKLAQLGLQAASG